MSKYDSSDHAQFYIGVDGGGTSGEPASKMRKVVFWVRVLPGLLQRVPARTGRCRRCARRVWRRPTPFLLEVMGLLEPDAFTLVAWAEQATATEYASLAPVALSYAEAGDPFAEAISLLGGLASRLVQWLSPDVLQFLSPPEGDAVAGAPLLARREGRARAEPRRQRKVRRYAH
jgi:N-acetylglucosamine kinase-like BadF-type ATPase